MHGVGFAACAPSAPAAARGGARATSQHRIGASTPLPPPPARRRALVARAAGARPAAAPLPAAARGGPAGRRRFGAEVKAQALVARGRSYSAEQVAVKKPLGEGSYGQVFEVRGARTSHPRACMPLRRRRTCSVGTACQLGRAGTRQRRMHAPCVRPAPVGAARTPACHCKTKACSRARATGAHAADHANTCPCKPAHANAAGPA